MKKETEPQGRYSFGKIKLFFREVLKQGTSIQLRLWIFLSLVALQFIAFILMVMLSVGAFDFSESRLSLALETQMTYHKQHMLKNLDYLNIKGEKLAADLSHSIENILTENETPFDKLDGDAPALEKLLSKLAPDLFQQMPEGNASGIYLMLDLSNGAGSSKNRAGLMMRNLEPNSISRSTPNIWMKYGPSSIAKALGIRILPQWRMEFGAKMHEQLQHLKKLSDQHQGLSMDFYLSPAIALDDTEDKAFYLNFPVYDGQNRIIGLCGFEINAMLFKLLYSTPNLEFPSSISLMAPGESDRLMVCQGLISSQTTYFNTEQSEDCLISSTSSDGGLLKEFRSANGEELLGLSQELVVYSHSKPLAVGRWHFAVLFPKKEFQLIESAFRLKTMMWMLFGFMLNFLLLVLLSGFYMGPIHRTLKLILQGSSSEEIERTGIIEIDDLLQFLKAKEISEEAEPTKFSSVKANAVSTHRPKMNITAEEANAFKQRISSLSPAEKAVFDLYLEGHNAQEITELLYLSINTIKTHNKRIYMKLDVHSRRELLEYVYFLEDQEQGLDK